MDQKEIEHIFFEDGYRLAKHHLDKELDAPRLKSAIGDLYSSMDTLLEALLIVIRVVHVPSSSQAPVLLMKQGPLPAEFTFT